MDFIFVSLQRINTDRESTSTSIAKELAKTYRVLYVNPPIDRKTWLFSNPDPFVQKHIKNIKERKDTLYKATENTNLWILTPRKIIESLNWIPSTKVFSFLNRINNIRFSSEIKQVIKQLEFKNFNLIIDKDIFRSYYLKELLKPKSTIYLDRDYTLGFSYWKRHGSVLEPRLISKCDAVVCNSSEFTNNNKAYNKNSFYIGNGANLSVFNPELTWDQPEELVSLERPLIGYVGALVSSRLSISLIAEIAKNLPSGTLVLLGPQDPDFLKSDLHKMKNIHFIDKKNTKNVPTYLSYFDVCINPQLLNKITAGNFPLKIVEYLAMGKPVVATATNTMKEVFADCTYLAQSPSEFSEQIQNALIEDDANHREYRINVSKKHCWETVSHNLLRVITNLNELTSKELVND